FAHGVAQGGRETRGLHCAAYHQRHPGARQLPITEVDRLFDLSIQAGITDVVDHADDGRAKARYRKPFAERVFIGEESARESFAEQRDFGPILSVAVVDEPAGAQGYAHGAEIVGIDPGHWR